MEKNSHKIKWITIRKRWYGFCSENYTSQICEHSLKIRFPLYLDFCNFMLFKYEKTLIKMLSQDERTESSHELKKNSSKTEHKWFIWTIFTRLEVSRRVLKHLSKDSNCQNCTTCNVKENEFHIGKVCLGC